MFGYNPVKEKPDWNLAIDRIIDIKETQQKYRKNTEINWKEYFEDIIGVTKPDSPIENIILLFFGKTGKYMESKPLHGSQKSKWINDNTLEVKNFKEVLEAYRFLIVKEHGLWEIEEMQNVNIDSNI